MNREAAVNENSSGHSWRRLSWLCRSPSRSTSRRARNRSIEINSSFKSASTTGTSSVESNSGGFCQRKSRRGGRRPTVKDFDHLAAAPCIRPGLSTQKSWKDSFKFGRGVSSKASDATSKDMGSEASSTCVSSHKRLYSSPSYRDRAERLPVNGPPRTILAPSEEFAESHASIHLDSISEPDTVGASSIEDITSSSSTRRLNQSFSGAVPVFLNSTSLYSDTDQALSATRTPNSPHKKNQSIVHDVSRAVSRKGNGDIVMSSIPSLTITEGSSWRESQYVLSDRSGKDSRRRYYPRENSMKSRHSAAISEATSLAESSVVNSTGYLSSAGTSLENSSFSRPSGLVSEYDGSESNTSLDLDQLYVDDEVQLAENGTGSNPASGLTAMEREKEMLELAIQRSLNDSNMFQYQARSSRKANGRYPSRQCALFQPTTDNTDKKTTQTSNSSLDEFTEVKVTDDARAAEILAEKELLELAMERSIADASAFDLGGAGLVSISSIYFDDAQSRLSQTCSTRLPTQEEDERESWQDRCYVPSNVGGSDRRTDGHSHTDSRRRPNLRSRSVEISDSEDG